ncbi:MAG: ribbon-helix-helix protein, CopG family [Thermaerobacter sp.]|nr:ribbon-helix-helix protein, CopG family [Thermaerobacter sp.]
MIRKQIFIPRDQDEALKRLSQRTGKSEGALVRDAIALRLQQEDAISRKWQELLREWASRSVDNQPRTWRRDDLYSDRVSPK